MRKEKGITLICILSLIKFIKEERRESKRKMRKEKGITLIALVVTIVVLLILAGVSISMLTGENGIITQAQQANIKNDNGTVLEALRLKLSQYLSENEGTYVKDKLELLRDDSIIDENNIVNVLELVEQKLDTGNGSNNKDVYVIEENHLYYYSKKGNKTDLGDLGNLGETLEETNPDLFLIAPDGTIYVKNKDIYYSNQKQWPVENVVIPKEINGITVTKIGYNFFQAGGNYLSSSSIANNLKSVVIPDTVTEIGDNAFYYCEGLTSITIPDSVKTIGNHAFGNCQSLTSITIPDSVTIIGNGAFTSCTSLTNITISNNITSIMGYTFGNCKSLTSIVIPEKVANIASDAFMYCDKLKRITINRPSFMLSGEPWGAENAEIEYNGEKYFKFAEKYLDDKNQEELEELILKTYFFIGTYEEFLQEWNIRQDAEEKGVEYIKYLKEILINDEYSWLIVEYSVSIQGGEGKTVQELEELFVEKIGYPGTFEQSLEEYNMTREDFKNMVNENGFRTEEDFLKYVIYIE